MAESSKILPPGSSNFLPAVIFLIGCLLSFATGTSWGTFGILIPIVVEAFQHSDHQMMIIAISACMAGSGLRGPLLPYLGHHHYVLRRRPVQPRQSCGHPASLRSGGRCHLFRVLYRGPALQRAPWFSLPFGLIVLFLILFLIRETSKEGLIMSAEYKTPFRRSRFICPGAA